MTRSFFPLLGFAIYAFSLIVPLWASALPYDSLDVSLPPPPSYGLEKRSSASKSKASASGGVAEEIIDFMQVIMEGGIQ